MQEVEMTPMIENTETNELLKSSQKSPKLSQIQHDDSNLGIETDNLLQQYDQLHAIEKKPIKKLQETLKNQPIFKDFWEKTTEWKKRKEIAEDFLKNELESNKFHLLAFRGETQKILDFCDQEKEKVFSENEGIEDISKARPEDIVVRKNLLGLTPLIYAVWGEENRKDEEKTTSKLILKLSEEKIKRKLGKDYGKFLNSSKVPFDLEIKNELGHCLLHEIIYKEYNVEQKYLVYHLISEDLVEAVSYFFERKGFELIVHRYYHSLCNYQQEQVSILVFALRIKSIQCATLFLNEIINHLSNPEYSYMFEIIQNDLPEYISFSSSLVIDLLERLINTQEKSLQVNIEKVPQFKMLSCIESEVISKAYTSFDNMLDSENFIKSQILNSQVKLPSLTGSEKSLKVIQALAETENLALFRTKVIKSYLQYKWDENWLLVFFQSTLMWLNIPLVVLLVFVDRFNIFILSAFTVVNGILALFETLQFTSMNLFQYFGNVDKKHACLGIRVLTLALIFLDDFQPYSCVIYFCISVCFAPDNGKKVKIVFNWIFFGIFICFFFPAFWAKWEYVYYLMIGMGSLWLMIVLCFIRSDTMRNVAYLIGKSIQLALHIVILFLSRKNLGILVLTQFLAGNSFIIQIFISLTSKKFTKLFIDFFLVIIFSINFYTSSSPAFYTINSLSTLLALCGLLQKKSEFVHTMGSYSSIIFFFTFYSSSLIGFNLEDSFSLKLFIIFQEIFFVVYFSFGKVISFSLLIKNTLSMVFCWNSIDFTQIIVCIVWLSFQFSESGNLGLTYALVALILMRGLTGFRCFQITRYYVRLILNSIHDILPFILIFFYSTLSFGIICSIYKDISISEIWMYPYDLNLGSASHESTFDMNYISFFIATVINVIVMLNLLISILGDSFDRFQVNASEIDLMEMAQTLFEVESMFIWRRNKNDSGKYLIGILNEGDKKKGQGKITKNEFFELVDDVADIKNDMKKHLNVVETQIMQKIQESQQEYKKDIEKEMKNLKNDILETIDLKIMESENRIIASIENLRKFK